MQTPPENKHYLNDVFVKLAEKSRDVFWVRSKDYKQQLYMSPVFERIWGRKCAEVYEHPERWEDWLYPEDQKALEESIGKRNPKTSPSDVFFETYRIVRPDGEIRFIRDTSFPIFDANHKLFCFAGIAQDVTDDRRREDELLDQKEKAEAANNAKDIFMENMSHDFKTPLNGIYGIVQLLSERKTEFPDDVKELIDLQEKSALRLKKLIESILDFNKLYAGKLQIEYEELNLLDIIEAVVYNLTYQLKNKNLDIIIHYPHDVPRQLISDSHCITSIILNLMSNAVKFAEKGKVIISVKTLSVSEDNVILQISVQDTGPGIPKNKFQEIFERFHRLEPSSKGLKEGHGIGLATVKEMIDKLNGKIEVVSKVGEGSTFTVNLPFELSDASFHLTEWKKKNSDVHILVVSDEDTSTGIFLELFDKEIIKKTNSSAILKKIKTGIKNKKPYQILIIDDEVDTDIISLIKEVSNATKASPMMILLSIQSKNNKKKKWFDSAKSAGCFDFIMKPLLPTEIDKKMVDLWKKWTKKNKI